MGIRNFEKQDMPLLSEFYKTVTSKNSIIFWWIGEESNWKNVYCAFENNKMIGKGQVGIINIIPEGRSLESKHSIYVNLKVLPEMEDDLELLDKIYEKLFLRAKDLKKTLSDKYQTLLCVGNYTSEKKNNTYFAQHKGFQHLINIYTMGFDLKKSITELELKNENMKFAQWDMKSSDEENQYLEIESEIWPDAPLGFERLHEYKRNPLWTDLVVRHGDQLVGSVMVWKEQDIGIIEDVFVRKPWRNQGIAKFLLTQALIYLKKDGIHNAKLVVHSSNQSALNLYKTVGFEILEEEIRHYITSD